MVRPKFDYGEGEVSQPKFDGGDEGGVLDRN